MLLWHTAGMHSQLDCSLVQDSTGASPAATPLPPPIVSPTPLVLPQGVPQYHPVQPLPPHHSPQLNGQPRYMLGPAMPHPVPAQVSVGPGIPWGWVPHPGPAADPATGMLRMGPWASLPMEHALRAPQEAQGLQGLSGPGPSQPEPVQLAHGCYRGMPPVSLSPSLSLDPILSSRKNLQARSARRALALPKPPPPPPSLLSPSLSGTTSGRPHSRMHSAVKEPHLW